MWIRNSIAVIAIVAAIVLARADGIYNPSAGNVVGGNGIMNSSGGCLNTLDLSPTCDSQYIGTL